VVGQQDPELVAAQPPPTDGHRAAVGVRVVGDDHVGARLTPQLHDPVHHAGLLGVRERYGGEVGIGVRLSRLDDRSDHPGAPKDRQEGVTADPVQRGVGDLNLTVGHQRQPYGRVDIGVDQPSVDRWSGIVERQVTDAVDGGDVSLDLAVSGRDDLGSFVAGPPEVDLVAVVLRWVVAGGDHHPGVG